MWSWLQYMHSIISNLSLQSRQLIARHMKILPMIQSLLEPPYSPVNSHKAVTIRYTQPQQPFPVSSCVAHKSNNVATIMTQAPIDAQITATGARMLGRQCRPFFCQRFRSPSCMIPSYIINMRLLFLPPKTATEPSRNRQPAMGIWMHSSVKVCRRGRGITP